MALKSNHLVNCCSSVHDQYFYFFWIPNHVEDFVIIFLIEFLTFMQRILSVLYMVDLKIIHFILARYILACAEFGHLELCSNLRSTKTLKGKA